MPYLVMPGHLIRRLSQHSNQIFQEEMKSAGFDVTSVQFAAMQTIELEQEVEQSQIAAAIYYDKATLGGVIDRMEKKGWVSRKQSPKDKRARLVSLTAEGKAILEQLTPIVESLQDKILKQLVETERHQFVELARKVLG